LFKSESVYERFFAMIPSQCICCLLLLNVHCEFVCITHSYLCKKSG